MHAKRYPWSRRLGGLALALGVVGAVPRPAMAWHPFFHGHGVQQTSIGYAAVPVSPMTISQPMATMAVAQPTGFVSAPAFQPVSFGQVGTTGFGLQSTLRFASTPVTMMSSMVPVQPTAAYYVQGTPINTSGMMSFSSSSSGMMANGLSANPFLSGSGGGFGGLLGAGDANDDMLLRTDLQYQMLASRMGGEFQVRSLKNELRARLLREIRAQGGSTRNFNWGNFLWQIARQFFFRNFGGDMPGDIFGLIERLIRDLMREEGVVDQGGNTTPTNNLPSGRTFRIRGTIELLDSDGDNPEPTPPPEDRNGPGPDDRDRDDPAPPPRR